MIRRFKATNMSRWSWLSLSLLFVFVAAFSLSCNGEDCGEPDHILHIRVENAKITVQDENGNTSRHVKHGDWVQWQNHTGVEIELEFSRFQKLFGVWNAIVYPAGTPLTLQVREDADRAQMSYIPKGQVGPAEMPPPDLVVDPPN
jgi:hypothetical protein